MGNAVARRRPARGTPPRLEGRPARGNRLVITAAYVEERLARAREGRRRPGVRDARCCGAPVMPAWRHSATHARTGAENAGAVVRRPAQSARRGYHRLDRWSEEGGGVVTLRSLARKTAPDGARTAGGVARDARCGQTGLTHGTCRQERWRGGCLEATTAHDTHTHTHTTPS